MRADLFIAKSKLNPLDLPNLRETKKIRVYPRFHEVNPRHPRVISHRKQFLKILTGCCASRFVPS